MHQLSRPIKVISDLSILGRLSSSSPPFVNDVCIYVATTWIRLRRISTFSLPNFDCLSHRSLDSDYRTLRSLLQMAEFPFFRTGARSRHPLFDSSLSSFLRLCFSEIPPQSRYPRQRQIPLYISFVPCFSLRAVLLKYDRIRHHRSSSL